MFLALAYRSKWPNEWAKVWFYMKNDLTAQVDIKGIIQTPVATSFGYKKPTHYINFEAQAAIVAFNAICTHIGTRDLV
jgi:Rieske Fe-S protein